MSNLQKISTKNISFKKNENQNKNQLQKDNEIQNNNQYQINTVNEKIIKNKNIEVVKINIEKKSINNSNETNKIKITNKQKITQELLKKMLSYFNIKFTDINELINIEIERNRFLTPEIVEHFQKFKNEFKNLGYKTGKLTSLHKNNLIKQKFPAINMLRQLLKCNNLLLKPLIKSNGYDKITGRKNTIRYFIIKEKNIN
tara:strand:- start:1393 stop:1992 length:600 start_codon:yes stop_codon:yes gene_type:complete